MQVTETPIPGVLVIEPKVFSDERGFFLESFNQRAMASIGIEAHFVQDNHSRSIRNVLRGLHYQIQHAQAKLVRVVTGEILDVAVDLRRSSPAFGHWWAERLSAVNKKIFWIPSGLAHGFRVLSDHADVLYKATDFYDPNRECTIAWNDSDLNIDWQLETGPLVSAKDQRGLAFREAPKFD